MPEYTYECEACEVYFSKVFTREEYDQKGSKVRCPECKKGKRCVEVTQTTTSKQMLLLRYRNVKLLGTMPTNKPLSMVNTKWRI